MYTSGQVADQQQTDIVIARFQQFVLANCNCLLMSCLISADLFHYYQSLCWKYKQQQATKEYAINWTGVIINTRTV